MNLAAYPGQIILSVSPLESRALCAAIALVLSLRMSGGPLFPDRWNRHAVRRIQRKLKRAAADPS